MTVHARKPYLIRSVLVVHVNENEETTIFITSLVDLHIL
jgi:hypothetical protein